MDMQQLTLAEIARALAAKEFSASELSSHLLPRIKALDPQLNSFISLTEELAMSQAKAADSQHLAVLDHTGQRLLGGGINLVRHVHSL